MSGDALAGTPVAVAGVLGVSAEGSIVYFVAAGVLAANTREYEYVNAEGDREKASESAANEPGARELVRVLPAARRRARDDVHRAAR